jgi:hypothetical protein
MAAQSIDVCLFTILIDEHGNLTVDRLAGYVPAKVDPHCDPFWHHQFGVQLSTAEANIMNWLLDGEQPRAAAPTIAGLDADATEVIVAKLARHVLIQVDDATLRIAPHIPEILAKRAKKKPDHG